MASSLNSLGERGPQGGNRLPLGDQESIGRDAQRGVVVEAPPSSSFEMPEPHFLFELLIIALDSPTQLRQIYPDARIGTVGAPGIFSWWSSSVS
jgi:hypothetical protein